MSGFCDSAHFRETLRSYWISRKLNTPHAHFHHNNRHARPFSLYAGSVLRVHIFAEYGADGWWKIIIYDNKMSPDAVQLTCSLSRTTSQLFACYCSLCQLLEHLLLSSAGQYKRKLLEHFLTNTIACGLLFHIVLVQNAMTHQLLTICSPVSLSRELQCKVSRGWSKSADNFACRSQFDKQLVILEQGACDKLRTTSGVERSHDWS